MADALSFLPFAPRQHNFVNPSDRITEARIATFLDNNGNQTPLTVVEPSFSMAIDDGDIDRLLQPRFKRESSILRPDYGSPDCNTSSKAPQLFCQSVVATLTNIVCQGPCTIEHFIFPQRCCTMPWHYLAIGHIGHISLFDSMLQHLYHPDRRHCLLMHHSPKTKIIL